MYKSDKGHAMTSQHPTLLQQFRSFYVQNSPESLEKAIDYFAIFGGLGWEIDTDRPLMELIEDVILDNYEPLHREIIDITLGDKIYHSLLSGVAMGDGRRHTAFKRARLSADMGNPAVRYLCQNSIIELESTREIPLQKEHPNRKSTQESEQPPVSDRLNFTTPFVRFWFAFVSPLFKGIQEGDYAEAEERFANREKEFADPVFEKLSIELLKKSFEEDPIVAIGSYWDKEVEIAILAKTKSGKIIAGECKYTNAKLKKNELSRLKEKCTLAGFEPDIYVLVSKRGFSNELKALKGDSLRLFTAKSFKMLVEDVKSSEIIAGFPRV